MGNQRQLYSSIAEALSLTMSDVAGLDVQCHPSRAVLERAERKRHNIYAGQLLHAAALPLKILTPD